MLRYVLNDTDGQEYILTAPLSVTIRMDEEIPADDLYAVFPYQATGELKNITVYDGARPVFVGIVDEEEHALGANGRFLRISARSLAALLLDNEAMPRTYDHPSSSLIYDRHVRPYGIRIGDPDDAVYFGEQTITKGMSEWGVLKSYCNMCYSGMPRISADGVLYMKGLKTKGSLVFSDSGDGIPYLSLEENIKRHERISAVNVKISNAGGYTVPITDAEAIDSGIRRERYLNAVLTTSPMRCADTMIEKGRSKAYELSLRCPVGLTDILGMSAQVRCRDTGDRDGLYVSSLTYRLSSDGETTVVKLKRRYG